MRLTTFIEENLDLLLLKTVLNNNFKLQPSAVLKRKREVCLQISAFRDLCG